MNRKLTLKICLPTSLHLQDREEFANKHAEKEAERQLTVNEDYIITSFVRDDKYVGLGMDIFFIDIKFFSVKIEIVNELLLDF